MDRLDEAVANAAHHRLAASSRNRLLGHLRGAEVVEARRARIGLEEILRNKTRAAQDLRLPHQHIHEACRYLHPRQVNTRQPVCRAR